MSQISGISRVSAFPDKGTSGLRGWNLEIAKLLVLCLPNLPLATSVQEVVSEFRKSHIARVGDGVSGL